MPTGRLVSDVAMPDGDQLRAGAAAYS